MPAEVFVAVLGTSICLQLAAAILAILNVRLTAARVPWLTVSAAIVLMTIRRMITFRNLIRQWGEPNVIRWAPELTALTISVLMLSGMIGLRVAARRNNRKLREKDLVLKSSLHQTKNNLQSLRSLIHLQADFTESHESRAIMAELEQKVAVYAALQRQIFETTSAPDCGSYLRDVAASVVDSYDLPECPLDFRDRVAPMEATPRELLTCGIVVSEALTNACKYATTPGKRTIVTVSAGTDGDRRFVEVRDDGPGFSADNLSGEKVGFGLVYLQSLNTGGATVTLENSDGAVVRYEF